MASNNEIIQAGEELVENVLKINDGDCYDNDEFASFIRLAVIDYKEKIK